MTQVVNKCAWFQSSTRAEPMQKLTDLFLVQDPGFPLELGAASWKFYVSNKRIGTLQWARGVSVAPIHKTSSDLYYAVIKVYEKPKNISVLR